MLLLLCAHGLIVLQFIKFRKQLHRCFILHLLHSIQKNLHPTALADRAQGNTTRLADLLSAGVHSIRRRSTVFVVSDFISEPGWEKPLGQLAQRHEVVAVRLIDPLEQHLPDLGLLTLRDAETGEHLLVDTHDAAFRYRFATVAAQREEALHSALARAGVDALELSTADDLAEAVMRFAELRRQRTRTGGGHPQSGMPRHLRPWARSRDNGASAS